MFREGVPADRKEFLLWAVSKPPYGSHDWSYLRRTTDRVLGPANYGATRWDVKTVELGIGGWFERLEGCEMVDGRNKVGD